MKNNKKNKIKKGKNRLKPKKPNASEYKALFYSDINEEKQDFASRIYRKTGFICDA